VLTARVDLNWSRYTSRELVIDFADQLMQRMSTQGGVKAVAVSSDFPLNNGGIIGLQPFLIRSRPVEAGQEPPNTDVTSVSPDYFRVIGVPLLRGRIFTNADRDTANIPAIISRRLAETHWKGRDPAGDQVSIDNGRRWLTVIGVVGDVRQTGPAQNITDEIYIPFLASPTSDMRVLVQAMGSPAGVAAGLRGAVRALDDRQPIVSVQTLEELRGTRLSEPRVATILLAAFAIISLVITTGGLGGVVAYSVSQRTTEIGIRMALGAERRDILWSVTREGAIVIAAGLLVGVATALAVTRVLGSLLYEVTTTDVWTYAAVTVVLALIGVISCLVPARRALRVDPIKALRAR
jgi:putative ABC transport system permease protein